MRQWGKMRHLDKGGLEHSNTGATVCFDLYGGNRNTYEKKEIIFGFSTASEFNIY